MKNSGIEWIGEIPDSWKLVRFKDICVNKKEIAGESSENYERLALTLGGVIKRPKYDSDGLQPKEFDGYQIICENDFIFKMIDLQNISTSRVGLSPYCGLVSPAYIRFSSREEGQYNEYVYYFLMSMYYNCVYNNLGGNGVRSALNATDIGQLVIPFPAIEKQKKIVAFLENAFKKIDNLIEVQQAQIDKLKEYKQSVITEAVTKGLDPTVPMKDSGVEWIGYVNASYKIQNIRSIFTIRKEIIGKEPETVLSITQSGLKIKSIHENAGQMADSYSNYQIVHVGDFAMNHMDLLTGGIGISQFEGVTSPDYRVFELSQSNMCAKYFLYIFLAYYKNKIFYAFGQGAANLGRWRLPAQNFYSIYIPVPDGIEQQQIADYLDDKCAKIDKLIAIKQAKIDKLQEYKKSLIYEYVTGKKEIV